MLRVPLSSLAALAACAPSPQQVAPGGVDSLAGPGEEAEVAVTSATAPQAANAIGQAAQGPIPEPVSAAAGPAPASSTEPAALGRRILTTAFVMVGAGGHLTVNLRSGRVLSLRDVTMGANKYCGVHVAVEDRAGSRYCGSYADIVAARAEGPSGA